MAKYSRANLKADQSVKWANNTTKAITPQRLRQPMVDCVDSFPNIVDDGRTIVVETISALKAYDWTDVGTGTEVSWLSYSVAGDNGGNKGRVDKADTTTAEDGISVFVASDGTRIKVVNISYNASKASGSDWGAKVATVIAAMPSTGGVIDCTSLTGAQSISANLTINKPVRVLVGASTITLGAYKIIISCSGASIVGLGKQDENNSQSRFIYSGTGNAVEVIHPTTSTPIFGVRLDSFEVSATGSAASSATASGIASFGTRYYDYNNIQVFNFGAGNGMYFTGNGVGAQGFGATGIIRNPALSGNGYGIRISADGGTHSTHGLVINGFNFSTVSAFDVDSESWRVVGTDFGGGTGPAVKIRSNAWDTVIESARFEAQTSEVVIDSGVQRTQIVAPSFINHQGGGVEITDNGSGTIIVTSSATTDSKFRAVRSQLSYSSKGTTATLAQNAFADVLDMSPGGTWIVNVMQADGGTAWRASAIVFSSGSALSVITLGNANVTITGSSANLRITNTNASDQAFAWTALKLLGPLQF